MRNNYIRKGYDFGQFVRDIEIIYKIGDINHPLSKCLFKQCGSELCIWRKSKFKTMVKLNQHFSGVKKFIASLPEKKRIVANKIVSNAF